MRHYRLFSKSSSFSVFQLFGKEIIKQLKKHKNKGKKEPFKLGKIKRKRKLSFNESDYSSDEDDKAKMFSMTLAQLAWERDIDLTKGKTFVSDPSMIEKLSPFIGKEEPGKTVIENHHHSPAVISRDSPAPNHNIPNGVKHRAPGERTVKKPAGTPKSSPKSATTKQFSYNRVSPLALTKQASPTDESGSDLEVSKPSGSDSVLKGMSVTDISLHGTDSSKSSHRRMFLEESKPSKEVKKLHWEEVPNVASKPDYASSKTSSVKSESGRSETTKSKSDSEYVPSVYSKSEDGYTSQGSVESSSRASKVSRGAESASSRTSRHSSRSTTTVDESTVSKSPKVGTDCSLQEIDSETEDTSRISKVSTSQRETEHETSESSAKPPKPSRTPVEENQPKKHKHKRKKSKKSRHGSRTSSSASLLHSSEQEDHESQV